MATGSVAVTDAERGRFLTAYAGLSSPKILASKAADVPSSPALWFP